MDWNRTITGTAPGQRLLVGRTAVVDSIRGLVRGLARGNGHMLWLEGEPGIGKTTMLDVAWQEAGRQGCLRFHALAEELAQQFPLRVLLDCLDPGRVLVPAGPVAAGTPAPGGIVATADPVMAAVERLVTHVERVCAVEPALLVLDDLHFADPASLLLWRRLSGLVGQLPLLLAVGCRPVPRRIEVGGLRRAALAHGAILEQLDPLTEQDVDALVTALTGGPPGQALRRAVAHAGGNPLYVREVVEAHLREGRPTGEHRMGEPRMGEPRMGRRGPAEQDGDGAGPAPPPTTLDTVIRDRLSYLSPAAFELLRTAALLGAEFSVDDLAAVARRPAATMVGAIEEAIQAGVLVSRPSWLAFRHGLIRTVLYTGLPPAVRAALHREAAHALDDAGLPADRVAEHLVHADTVDAWFIDWLTRSAEMLIHRAPSIAVDLLQRGIAALGPGSEARSELEAHLATTMFHLGRFDEAERLSRHATAGVATPDKRARLTWIRAYALLRMFEQDRALTVITEHLDRPAGMSAAWQARLRALRAVILGSKCQYHASEVAADSVLATDGVDPIAAGYALLSRFSNAVTRQDIAPALDHVTTALTLIGDDPQAADLRVLLLSNRVYLTMHLDRPADAEQFLVELLQAAEQFGAPVRLAMSRMAAATQWFEYGRWDDAVAEMESLAAEGGIEHPLLGVQLHGLAALIAEHRDDQEAAERHFAAVQGIQVDLPDIAHQSVALLQARAVRAERLGDIDGALAELRTLADPASAEEFNQLPVWLPEAARLALETGDRKTAEEAAALALARADRLGTLSSTALGEWCAGLLDGDPDPLARAAERYAEARRPYDLARVMEDLAVLHARAGNLVAARAVGAGASERYARLRAAWDSLRAEARLRPLGVRRGQRGPRRRPASGWASLTPAELRVGELIAKGLPNPDIATALFLSRRTVETHVSHILGKLGARSRIEIAREVARQGSSGPAG